MKRTGVFALVGACLFAAGFARAAPVKLEATASPLEGTRWQVKVTPDEAATSAGEKVFDDTLVFDGGKVSMSECVKAGFGATPYSVSPSDRGWSFRTEQTSRKEGKSTWAADIEGDSIKGTLTRTKKKDTVLHYTFEGKKVAK